MLAARPPRWCELPFEFDVWDDKLVVHKDRHTSRLPRTSQLRTSITVKVRGAIFFFESQLVLIRAVKVWTEKQ